MSTHAAHLQQPGDAAGARQPLADADAPRPVTFYSIEIDTPARDFWECLARLLSLLGALARRRACGR